LDCCITPALSWGLAGDGFGGRFPFLPSDFPGITVQSSSSPSSLVSDYGPVVLHPNEFCLRLLGRASDFPLSRILGPCFLDETPAPLRQILLNGLSVMSISFYTPPSLVFGFDPYSGRWLGIGFLFPAEVIKDFEAVLRCVFIHAPLSGLLFRVFFFMRPHPAVCVMFFTFVGCFRRVPPVAPSFPLDSCTRFWARLCLFFFAQVGAFNFFFPPCRLPQRGPPVF